MHWWQSKPTDGSIGGWGSDPLSFSLCLFTPSTTKEFTTSKTNAFCEYFLSYWIWQHKKRRNSARLPLFLNCSVYRAGGLLPLRFAFVPLHLPKKYCACHEKKKWGQVIRSAAPATQNHLTWPKCNPSQRPEEMSLVLRLPRDMHLCSSSSKSSSVPPLLSFLQLLQNPHVVLTFP